MVHDGILSVEYLIDFIDTVAELEQHGFIDLEDGLLEESRDAVDHLHELLSEQADALGSLEVAVKMALDTLTKTFEDAPGQLPQAAEVAVNAYARLNEQAATLRGMAIAISTFLDTRPVKCEQCQKIRRLLSEVWYEHV